MNLFDFLKWVLEDFWRFCGIVIILTVIGDALVSIAKAMFKQP